MTNFEEMMNWGATLEEMLEAAGVTEEEYNEGSKALIIFFIFSLRRLPRRTAAVRKILSYYHVTCQDVILHKFLI
jgi:hypothetical protein